jgi:hypothetical protein
MSSVPAERVAGKSTQIGPNPLHQLGLV